MPIKQEITPDATAELLNELLSIDRQAVSGLIATRIPCNDLLADHPTVQVVTENGQCKVGFLGILNGLFGVDDKGYGPIAIEVKEEDMTTIERFVVRKAGHEEDKV
jgi:hypothetical protein